VENKMNQVKKLLFGQTEWEVVFKDGKTYFLLKDLLQYFGYKPSSQGSFIDHVQLKNKVMLSGGDIMQQLTHITGRGWIVNHAGIKEFVKYKKGTDKHQPGVILLNWIKTVQMQKEFKEKPEQADLMDFIYEEEIIALKKVVVDQSERIDQLEKRIQALEKQIKEGMAQGMIQAEGDRKLIDVDVMMEFLQKTGVNGNLK
jgi:hypothetical protein